MEACETFPNGFLPPLKKLRIEDHFTGNLKEQVQKFMTEIPKELFEKLSLGHVHVDVTNGDIITSKDHHFFPWFKEELLTVMVHNWNTH
jgi:glutamine synthetase type III